MNDALKKKLDRLDLKELKAELYLEEFMGGNPERTRYLQNRINDLERLDKKRLAPTKPTQPMKSKYSHDQKITYYSKRISDQKLTPGQRAFAKNRLKELKGS